MNETDSARLLEAACAALPRAYAPYSHFPVGAAVRCKDSATFTGCNVENASFGLTICAERVAICTAIAAGHTDVQALAVVSETDPPAPPCGACLQVLSEFAKPECLVLVAPRTRLNKPSVYRLADLLPVRFLLENGR